MCALLLVQWRQRPDPANAWVPAWSAVLQDGSGHTRPISGVKQVVGVADEPVEPLDQLYSGEEGTENASYCGTPSWLVTLCMMDGAPI